MMVSGKTATSHCLGLWWPSGSGGCVAAGCGVRSRVHSRSPSLSSCGRRRRREGARRRDARRCSLGARKELSADGGVEAKFPFFALYAENFQKVYSILLLYSENQMPVDREVTSFDREQEFQRTFYFSRLSCSSEEDGQGTAGTCVPREQATTRGGWVWSVASRFGLPCAPRGGQGARSCVPPGRTCVPGRPRPRPRPLAVPPQPLRVVRRRGKVVGEVKRKRGRRRMKRLC